MVLDDFRTGTAVPTSGNHRSLPKNGMCNIHAMSFEKQELGFVTLHHILPRLHYDNNCQLLGTYYI